MALLLRDRGVFTQFPWLQFTVLKASFADHQFLYHLLLIPFVTFWPPLVGLKLATVVFFAVCVTAFYGLLRFWKVRGAAAFTAVLLVSGPFIFRVNLAKAQGLALALLFICLACLQVRRSAWLLVLGFLYVWLYAGWPLLPVLAGLWVVASWAFHMIVPPRRLGFWRWKVGPSDPSAWQGWSFALRILFFIAIGITAGIVVNPYFPHNLQFYWNQIIQIAVINYKSVIGVGGEWYPYPALELIAATTLSTFCAMVGLTVYALTIRRQSARSTFLLLCLAMFALLTLRSRRNVEYLVPFEILFSAVAISQGLVGLPSRGFWREFREFLAEQKLFLIAALLPLVLVPFLVARDLVGVWSAYAESLPLTKYQQSATWLAEHSPAGSIVFQGDWDDFPILFYYNSHDYYLVGLDPTFMYRYDAKRYWQWERVTTGRERVRLHDVVAKSFSARYLFIGMDNEPMTKLVSANLGFREIYRDDEAIIFEVLPMNN